MLKKSAWHIGRARRVSVLLMVPDHSASQQPVSGGMVLRRPSLRCHQTSTHAACPTERGLKMGRTPEIPQINSRTDETCCHIGKGPWIGTWETWAPQGFAMSFAPRNKSLNLSEPPFPLK